MKLVTVVFALLAMLVLASAFHSEVEVDDEADEELQCTPAGGWGSFLKGSPPHVACCSQKWTQMNNVNYKCK
jgi:hypothetical protein